jgi:hypothetical protein
LTIRAQSFVGSLTFNGLARHRIAPELDVNASGMVTSLKVRRKRS